MERTQKNRLAKEKKANEGVVLDEVPAFHSGRSIKCIQGRN